MARTDGVGFNILSNDLILWGVLAADTDQCAGIGTLYPTVAHFTEVFQAGDETSVDKS